MPPDVDQLYEEFKEVMERYAGCDVELDKLGNKRYNELSQINIGRKTVFRCYKPSGGDTHLKTDMEIRNATEEDLSNAKEHFSYDGVDISKKQMSGGEPRALVESLGLDQDLANPEILHITLRSLDIEELKDFYQRCEDFVEKYDYDGV